MARKGQRTGIFDLEDVTEAIQLPSFEGSFIEEDTILITPPKLMIDVAELHEGKKGVEINSALLIVKGKCVCRAFVRRQSANIFILLNV